MDLTKFASIKSPPLDDGLKIFQLIAHDEQQEQQVAEGDKLDSFAFCFGADQHSDGDRKKLCEEQGHIENGESPHLYRVIGVISALLILTFSNSSITLRTSGQS